MSAYYPEPTTVGELLARYRDVKRRLYPPIGPTGGQTMTTKEAEAILAFAVALTLFMTSRADESERRAAAAATIHRRPTASAAQRARAAVAAVSSRTGVPVEEIFGRKRIPAVASARHEAIWRVRRVTNWSLPRVGRYFAERDHTTILHSIRRMEDRAARDPTIRAYMTSIERECSREERTSEPATGSPGVSSYLT
jgi:chromosomal replication initiation ATPase DnaA